VSRFVASVMRGIWIMHTQVAPRQLVQVTYWNHFNVAYSNLF
jgi:hypothetical protein